MVTHSIYCLPTDTLAGLKLLVRTYIIFEGIKYSLSLEHTNMTDITHSILKLIFSIVYSLTPILIFFLFNLHFLSSLQVFACNNSRKKRGKDGHYSKIGANQKRSAGGKNGEADTSSQTVTHLFMFFCYVAEYLHTYSPIHCLNHKSNGNKFFYSLYLQTLFHNKTEVINIRQH